MLGFHEEDFSFLYNKGEAIYFELHCGFSNPPRLYLLRINENRGGLENLTTRGEIFQSTTVLENFKILTKHHFFNWATQYKFKVRSLDGGSHYIFNSAPPIGSAE